MTDNETLTQPGSAAPLTAIDAAAEARDIKDDLTARVAGSEAAAALERSGGIATGTPLHVQDVAHAAGEHGHRDTLLPYTMFRGQRLPFPLYTSVFLTLGVLTIVEVIIAELPEFFLTVPLLVVLSLAKAVLVVYFYMHLREDSRIFAAALILPVLVGLIATLFLAVVPPTGY